MSATPPAAVIDPQSAGTADTVTKARRDWKRPREVNRRKRLVDVACLLLAGIILGMWLAMHVTRPG